jgi:RimJ/RimL family protein N-acetyltransferase
MTKMMDESQGKVRFALKNGPTVMIREVVPEDAAQLSAFRKKIAEETTHTLNYVGMPMPSIEEISARLASLQGADRGLNIGAFDGDRLIGYLNFRMTHPEHPWFHHVGAFGMMILEEFWGQGLAKGFLARLDEHASGHRITRIEAMVRVKNERGVRLYQQAGFAIEGTKRHAALIDGEWQDEYYIAKILHLPQN